MKHVKQELIAKYGVERVFKGGFEIYTTLDPEMQVYAENAIREILPDPEDPAAALVALDPKNGYIHYNLAEAYLFQKKYADAEKALGQAVNLMPDSADAYGRMGLVYEKQKKWDSALKAYKKAAGIESSDELKEAIERVTKNRKR